MDKRYYYRILGLVGEPTRDQIEAAYETRIAKLRSSDYGDDPLYARRKISEVTMAYKVLTGSAPPVSKGQKKMAFERFKDYIENREGNDTKEELHDYDDFRAEKQTARKSHQAKAMRAEAHTSKRVYPHSEKRNTGNIVAIIVIIAGVVLVGVASVIGSSIFDEVRQGITDAFMEEDYDYGAVTSTVTVEEQEAIDDAQSMCFGIDFYGGLDTSAISGNRDDVIWGEGTDEYAQGDLFDNTCYLLYSMGIYNVSGYFDYVTGIPDFFFEYDDADCAAVVVDFMGAPDFEEVAGATDLYTGEPILIYSEYLQYLERIVYGYTESGAV